jgi:hypothetical protein
MIDRESVDVRERAPAKKPPATKLRSDRLRIVGHTLRTQGPPTEICSNLSLGNGAGGSLGIKNSLALFTSSYVSAPQKAQ